MIKKNISEVVMGAPLDRMPSKINHPFGEKRSYEVHPGVDLATPSGTPVKAPMDGEVVNVNNNGRLCGGTIDIDYKNGFWSRFCHIKRIDVRKGQIVKKGEVVGLSGGARNDPQRGNSKGAHLHFTLKKDGKLVDPMLYVDKFNVSTPEFPMSGATQSTDMTDWGDFFDAAQSDSNREKLRKKDPILAKILEPLTKMKFFESHHKNFIKQLSEEYRIEWADTYSSTEYRVSEGKKVVSPESGSVYWVGDHSKCKDSVILLHNLSNTRVYTLFCNVKDPSVRKGNSVSQGKKIGTAGNNCFIKVMDKDFSEIKFSKVEDLSKAKKDSDEDGEKIKKRETERRGDPILKAILKPLELLNVGKIKSASDTDKVPEFKSVSWLKKNTVSNNESLDRDINKIKRLL